MLSEKILEWNARIDRIHAKMKAEGKVLIIETDRDPRHKNERSKYAPDRYKNVVRTTRASREERDKKIIEMRGRWKMEREIAAELNISMATVYKAVRKWRERQNSPVAEKGATEKETPAENVEVKRTQTTFRHPKEAQTAQTYRHDAIDKHAGNFLDIEAIRMYEKEISLKIHRQETPIAVAPDLH